MIDRISGRTKILGVIGSSLDHSLSPLLQNKWIKENNINACYVPFPVSESHVDKIPFLFHMGVVGLNITFPYKETILFCCNQISLEAKKIGSVNVLSYKDGKITANNTDSHGFTENLKKNFNKNSFRIDMNHPVLILGAGGTTRSVLYSLIQLGYKSITITNRTLSHAELLKKNFPNIKILPWEMKNKTISNYRIFINTTSLGLLNKNAEILNLNLELLKEKSVFIDCVYKPLETFFLKNAKEKGHIAISGLDMLIYQAQKAFFYWFDVMPKVTEDLCESLKSCLK